MSIRYCVRCILPSTRPGLSLGDDGSCNCSFGHAKRDIDWAARRQAWEALTRRVKLLKCDYDVVIPVSGGKDSTWQVVTALEWGLRPLTVTWRTPARTQLGQANLDNLIKLGVDHLDVSVNPRIERLFTWKTYERSGSPALPMHFALHAIPINVARRFEVPLILQGENAAFEYGGNGSALTGHRITRAWLRQYGVTNGTTADDWVDEDLSLRDISVYQIPHRDEDIPEMVFLGHYFPWDPRASFAVAADHGFREAPTALVGTYNFADVDDSFIMAVHHWLKWHKFGFTRSWDNLSIEIRAGRLTREEAIKRLCEIGNETPHEAIQEFAKYAGKTVSQVHEVAERFRNKEIWSRHSNRWQIADFLIENWDWGD
ncbi:MAG: N-acetyl sugar amidotransferase [Planctomycetota bacterium]